jgi:hypothetical protein
VAHASGERQRFLNSDTVLFGIHLRGGGNTVGRKKLLRARTGLSTLAVVAPVDCFHNV